MFGETKSKVSEKSGRAWFTAQRFGEREESVIEIQTRGKLSDEAD